MRISYWSSDVCSSNLREGQEHRQGGDYVPKRVPSVVGNLVLRLLLDIEPDKRKKGDQGKCCNESPELVTALRRLRYQDNNGRREQIGRASLRERGGKYV